MRFLNYLTEQNEEECDYKGSYNADKGLKALKDKDRVLTQSEMNKIIENITKNNHMFSGIKIETRIVKSIKNSNSKYNTLAEINEPRMQTILVPGKRPIKIKHYTITLFDRIKLYTLIHELAHIITIDKGHGPMFKTAVDTIVEFYNKNC